jgi:hypothetical protein
MPKKCKHCGNTFVPKFSSLDKFCYEEDCRIAYAREKVAQMKAAKWKIQKAKLKENVKGIPGYKKDLEKEINKICCLIDFGSGCISCNGHTTPQAGHYHTVNSNGSIRYNLDNLHLQDYNCNHEKSGNIHQYDCGLIERYGMPYWGYVKFDIVRKYPLIKMTLSEYKEKIEIAKSIVKELKYENKTYTPQERLALRQEYNEKIGIYI